jgi:tetratricopeptide (TPR) repeat protein
MISSVATRAAGLAVLVGSVVCGGGAQTLQRSETLRASTSEVTTPSVRPVLTPEMRGDIYMARKMFLDAIEKFRECPSSAAVENKIGIAFHQLAQIDLAKKSYERAIKMNPKFPEAINNLGTVYYTKKNYGKAMKCYKKALKLSPDSPSIWVNFGSAYFAKHDMKHAVECYDQAMRIDPQVFERRSQYGTLLEERSVADRAAFHLYLAKAYAQRGDKERALLYLRKAMEEGVKDRKKIPEMPEFALLRTEQEFKDLLVQNPQPL